MLAHDTIRLVGSGRANGIGQATIRTLLTAGVDRVVAMVGAPSHRARLQCEHLGRIDEMVIDRDRCGRHRPYGRTAGDELPSSRQVHAPSTMASLLGWFIGMHPRRTHAIDACVCMVLVMLLCCRIGAAAAEQPWESLLNEQARGMADRLSTTLTPWPVPSRTFPVEVHQAVADGVTINTKAIQATIDACSAAGGGVVSFAKGDYVTGTIVLKSGVMLEIAKGSRLLGSLNLRDYPDHVAQRRTVMDTNMGANQSLIFAEGVERIGIRGLGEIDFRGTQKNFPGKQTISATPGRPFGIRIIDSRQVVVEDITLKNAACWMQNYLNCEDLIFQRMQVINHANYNNDGLDIDGCRRVIIRDCFINSEDDALCFKGAGLRPTEDVLIENSTFFSTCNALKIGTDTQGDFRRIYARNLRLGGIPEHLVSLRRQQASTGITLATVDGGDVEDIVIEHCTIERADCPIFLRIGSRGRVMPGMPPAKIGKLQRILIQDITGGDNFRQGSMISGIDGGLIEDVVLQRIDLSMMGGGTPEMAAAKVTEDPKGYPDAHQFSRNGLPSYGFFLRHVQRLHFRQVRVTPVAPDARPFFVADSSVKASSRDGEPLGER